MPSKCVTVQRDLSPGLCFAHVLMEACFLVVQISMDNKGIKEGLLGGAKFG